MCVKICMFVSIYTSACIHLKQQRHAFEQAPLWFASVIQWMSISVCRNWYTMCIYLCVRVVWCTRPWILRIYHSNSLRHTNSLVIRIHTHDKLDYAHICFYTIRQWVRSARGLFLLRAIDHTLPCSGNTSRDVRVPNECVCSCRWSVYCARTRKSSCESCTRDAH